MVNNGPAILFRRCITSVVIRLSKARIINLLCLCGMAGYPIAAAPKLTRIVTAYATPSRRSAAAAALLLHESRSASGGAAVQHIPSCASGGRHQDLARPATGAAAGVARPPM